jgi:hypothetical protein
LSSISSSACMSSGKSFLIVKKPCMCSCQDRQPAQVHAHAACTAQATLQSPEPSVIRLQKLHGHLRFCAGPGRLRRSESKQGAFFALGLNHDVHVCLQTMQLHWALHVCALSK